MRLGVLILFLLWLTGCASAIGGGYGQGGRAADGRSYAEARADNRISAAVTTVLVRDRQVPAMGIEVSTLNGAVTLSGRVPSSATAQRAAHLAATVAGVVRVDNRLRIGR